MGGQRKLHNELHNLYSTPIIRMIKPIRMGRELRNWYKILVGKSESRKSLRSRHRWKYDIRMDLGKTVLPPQLFSIVCCSCVPLWLDTDPAVEVTLGHTQAIPSLVEC